MLLKSTLTVLGSIGLLLAATATVNAASLAPSRNAVADAGSLITKVHSLDEAQDTLSNRGFNNIRVERATLPYSFNACKRGTRYHLHVNYYGQVEQADEIGPCREYGNNDDGDYRPRQHWRPHFRNHYGYNRYGRSGY